MKTCSKCQEPKPLADFYFNTNHGRYNAMCKKCVVHKQIEFQRTPKGRESSRRKKRDGDPGREPLAGQAWSCGDTRQRELTQQLEQEGTPV